MRSAACYQNESLLTTSPPWLVLRALQTDRAIELLKNVTLPYRPG
jgi:hypothetical protein